MSRSLCLILFFGIFLFSCIPHKKAIYFQKKSGAGDSIATSKFAYKIQSHDILAISISSLNPKISEFFNLKAEGDPGNINGYIVSETGFIYMPVLDSVKVTGMTVPQIQEKLRSLIKGHVTDATVIVKLANFNITALGEVNRPGIIKYEGTELTLIEALGLAGDITDMGNRTNVLLIRKLGTTEKFMTLDLTDRSIVSSEYFYLQPNDALYVEPLKAKHYRLNVSQITLILSFTTIAYFLYNVLKK